MPVRHGSRCALMAAASTGWRSPTTASACQGTNWRCACCAMPPRSSPTTTWCGSPRWASAARRCRRSARPRACTSPLACRDGPRHGNPRRGRPRVRRRPVRRFAGHAGGGAGPVLRHARAPEVPQESAHRGGACRGGGAPAGAGGPRRGVPAGKGRACGIRGSGAGPDRARGGAARRRGRRGDGCRSPRNATGFGSPDMSAPPR